MTESGDRNPNQIAAYDRDEQQRTELLSDAFDAAFVRLLLLLFIVSMIFGSLGPWGSLGGILGLSGTNGDGVFTLAASMVAALSLLFAIVETDWKGLAVCGFAGTAAAAIAAIDGIYLFSSEEEAVSIGWGPLAGRVFRVCFGRRCLSIRGEF